MNAFALDLIGKVTEPTSRDRKAAMDLVKQQSSQFLNNWLIRLREQKDKDLSALVPSHRAKYTDLQIEAIEFELANRNN